MIQSFKHKGLQRLFEKGNSSKIVAGDLQKLKRILAVLNRTAKPYDMALPGFHLHELKGKLKGFWSVRVRANWRVTFKVRDGDVYQVDLLDYH